MTPDEIADLSDADLDALVSQLQQEQQRRWEVRNALDSIDRATTAVLEAEGVKPGEPWQEPTGAHNAYPRDWTVAGEDGELYISQIAGNTHRPGDPADPQSWRWWRKVAEAVAGVFDPHGHAYKVGDEFTFEGLRYRVRQAHLSQPGWLPTIVAALYERIPNE